MLLSIVKISKKIYKVLEVYKNVFTKQNIFIHFQLHSYPSMPSKT